MSKSNFMAAAGIAVVKAGQAIRSLPRMFEVKAGEGHRSGVTKSDVLSQEILLRELEKFPHARFLCEEDTSHPRAFSKKNPQGILEAELVFVIDSIDSTARYGSELDGWCVAVGVMQYGIITGGVVFAPASQGGFCVVSRIGQGGVSTIEWEGSVERSVTGADNQETPSKKSIVLLGVDALLYKNVTAVVPEIAANVRGVYTSGSGILGLARVAARRAQAIIQTPQKAWDWIPAYRGVLETGNAIQLFRLVKGELVPVDSYDFEAMCTSKETKDSRLGFVAGEPAMVRRLFALLPRSGWERFAPDTVCGKW